MKKLLLSLCLLAAFVLCATGPAQADFEIYGFSSILPNWNEENVDIGETQLFVVVSDVTGTPIVDVDGTIDFIESGDIDDPLTPENEGDILFTFYNTGDYPCSIVDIYFYDGTLLVKPDGTTTLSIYDESDIYNPLHDVDFTEGAQPMELSTLEYLKLVDAYSVVGSADSDPVELIENGIGPDEWLSISFLLQYSWYHSDCFSLRREPLSEKMWVFLGLCLGVYLCYFYQSFMQLSVLFLWP